MIRRLAALAAFAALAACFGTPQDLPVAISVCGTNADGTQLQARVENKSFKPISRVEVTASFYYDFRYVKVQASATASRELDPGNARVLSFAVTGSAPARRQAIRCYATRLRFLDGTSQSAPQVQ